jgi:hypothetical protein
MKGILFLLLTIFFFGCASKAKEKEILSAELIYSNRASIHNYDSLLIDTIFYKTERRN